MNKQWYLDAIKELQEESLSWGIDNTVRISEVEAELADYSEGATV
jgi:hypothetical protein